MILDNTPVTTHQFDGVNFYLKRDDLLHPEFAGNKARKLMALLESPPQGVKTLIGYGSAQANSLYSIAAVAKLNGWRCQFYVDRIPEWLRSSPCGNYKKALELGAEVLTLPDAWRDSNSNTEQALKANLKLTEGELLVEEGGRMPLAEYGVAKLAREIIDWVKSENKQDVVVALPSGTGTTALYLHKHMCLDGVEVWTTPVVGGESYLIKQFEQLGETSHPKILTPETKHHFGKLYLRDYQTWMQLEQQTGVGFELLYDPLMWQVLMRHKAQLAGKTLLYIHQGGLVGNESMLPRYQRKYPQLQP